MLYYNRIDINKRIDPAKIDPGFLIVRSNFMTIFVMAARI